ncbi:MAG: polysaccharide deacetylase family protein [Prosthecobacter sp.]
MPVIASTPYELTTVERAGFQHPRLLVWNLLSACLLLTSCWPATNKAHRESGQPVKLGTLAAPVTLTGAGGTASRGYHLTFDDGPHPRHTPALLDWLKANKIRATFFVLGSNVQRYPELARRIVQEGHQIGNHSWSHANFGKLSDAKARSEIRRTHDVIVKTCGRAPTVFRPPYGILNARQRAWIQREFGYRVVLWDIDTEDWKLSSTSAIAGRITQGLRSDRQNVILAHDIHPRILPALKALLPRLRSDGFKALQITDRREGSYEWTARAPSR